MKLLNVAFFGGLGNEGKEFFRFILIASNLSQSHEREKEKLITDHSSVEIIQVITKIYSSRGKKGKSCEMFRDGH